MKTIFTKSTLKPVNPFRLAFLQSFKRTKDNNVAEKKTLPTCILFFSLVIVFICTIPFTSTAQFSNIINETRGNTTTAGDQYCYYWSVRTVAVQPDGGYITIWIDVNGLDGQAEGIFGQRFNASGAKVGSEFQVNTTFNGQQFAPTIAVAPDGQFIVAWEGPGTSIDVFAQRFDKNGVKIRSEFLLNTSISGNQRFPEIQFYQDGTWVAAYVDASGGQTVMQRFDTDDRTLGLETRISSGAGAVVLDALCVRPDNSVLLTWTAGADVYGQLFTTALAPIGTAKMINTYTAGLQEYTVARVDGDGNFVVVWESDGQDGSGMGIYGRRYDKNFNALGGEFAITTNTTNNQFEPQVAIEPGGRFIITWSDNNNRDGGGPSPILAGPGCSVWMREFAANGTPVGVETMVNQSITGYQGYPVIDVNAAGRFVIMWEGNGTQASNIDNYGVFTRAYQFSQRGVTAITVTPTTTKAGDTVTVTMTLTSPISTPLVTPNPLSVSGTNGVFATYISGPTPSSSTVGAVPVNYTFKYRITSEETSGTLTFGGNAHSDGVAIFPYAVSNTVSIKPSLFINDITAPNLVDDSNNPLSGPKAFSIGAKITNPGLDTLKNTVVYLGNGVTPGTFPVTTMTLAQTNNTYQGSFALVAVGTATDCTRPIGTLAPSKSVIAGQIDFDGNGLINGLDDGTLGNGKKVIDGSVDVNLSNTITIADDLPRPPGQFAGYREPAIIDGNIDINNDGIINASDAGTYGGETKNVYWLVRYAVKDAFDQPTFGTCGDFADDLRYKWTIWGTANDAGKARTDIVNDYAKVRCEQSAASNKIVPNPGGFVSGTPPRIIAGMVDINSDGIITSTDDGIYHTKTVIDGKLDMNNSGTITTADDGVIQTFIVMDGYLDLDNNVIINANDAGIIVTPGSTFSVTFNNATFGSVGAGFDENRDNLRDYDFWHQPIGETNWPAREIRLIDIKSYVTGAGGGNPLNGITTFYDNEPFVSRMIGTTGTFNATYTYTFQVLNYVNACLSPYQEAASGTDNEKFNNDYFFCVGIYTYGNYTILPTAGLEADAKLKNNTTAAVTWKTTTEYNTAHFIVERSIDGLNYTGIKTMQAAGNSNTQKNYAYYDDISMLQLQKYIYYRVKLVDNDGTIKDSNVSNIKLNSSSDIQVWPNPFVSSLSVTINSKETATSAVSLFDVQGRLVRSGTMKLSPGLNKLEIDNLENLPAGIYNLRVINQQVVKNFMLKKINQ